MLLIIGGATGTGKSKLAIDVAKRLNGEIISCDSMQIYRYMNIGTAKVTESEKEGVPHHLLDIIDPETEFSVAEYQSLAQNVIDDVRKRGKTPIITGGTGLYINSLIYPFGFSNTVKNTDLRNSLKGELERFGKEHLHNILHNIDAFAAEKVHMNNIKRVIRAIEIKLTTGKSIFDANEKQNPIPHQIYAIDIERATLYDKINKRVGLMFESGLLAELHFLLERSGVTFDSQSMQAIGYKEFRPYFEGEIDLETVKENIKKNTRNYAKRQMTWLRSYPNCKYLNAMNALDEIVSDL